ncbi:acyl-CoA dehydrogenase family protein [Mycobacterium vicinigordonae]|uniref:Acyl-CoA dehydrogenase family protein n=1 Tax=Mycobacterium vicinigordonae TaxID=1719132 RepID=A0A7D6I3Y5_9MYCO|nr:acyl-CoA dehydrogenase family protein [Mycobacterium vicinigordonae]QLL06378.1 acyl-CoA dehydrogenase family protein [Mycobacterium vicinigordonae]
MSSDVGWEQLLRFREDFRGWVAGAAEQLDGLRMVANSPAEQLGQARALQRLLYESRWARHGWPDHAGGLGGSVLLRGVVGEELTKAGYPPPFACSLIEVLGPAVLEFGSPELVAEFFPRLLDGTDVWCQGFSEPEAGSDLGALRTRAVDADTHWVVSGQKIWTSYAMGAQRCLLLARTGDVSAGFRGVTALFVDMDSPGVQVRPLRAMTGDDEFAELFFDEVEVPKARTVGVVDGGGEVVRKVLGNERGVLAWQRQAWLHTRLRDAIAGADAGASAPAAGHVGDAYVALHALRLRVRETFHAAAAGCDVGAGTSVDKILLSTAEKAVFDTALKLEPQLILLNDGPVAARWRYDHTYSRASSIYGGTAEIQRNIVAERLLRLPRER